MEVPLMRLLVLPLSRAVRVSPSFAPGASHLSQPTSLPLHLLGQHQDQQLLLGLDPSLLYGSTSHCPQQSPCSVDVDSGQRWLSYLISPWMIQTSICLFSPQVSGLGTQTDLKEICHLAQAALRVILFQTSGWGSRGCMSVHKIQVSVSP